MAAKGSQAKEEIIAKLKEVFPDSFVYDKVYVIPWQENGETVHIKLTLTCAKTLLSNDSESPHAAPANGMGGFPPIAQEASAIIEPTAEEKANVTELMSKLGLLSRIGAGVAGVEEYNGTHS